MLFDQDITTGGKAQSYFNRAELAGLYQRLSLVIGFRGIGLLAGYFLWAVEPAAHIAMDQATPSAQKNS
jgi:hypothetical protein